MSLSIAIDQIQRPSWWHDLDRTPAPKTKSPEVTERRNKLLEHLRHAGRKVSGKELQEHFKITNSQLWFLLNAMIKEGLVIKHKINHDRCLLEAA